MLERAIRGRSGNASDEDHLLRPILCGLVVLQPELSNPFLLRITFIHTSNSVTIRLGYSIWLCHCCIGWLVVQGDLSVLCTAYHFPAGLRAGIFWRLFRVGKPKPPCREVKPLVRVERPLREGRTKPGRHLFPRPSRWHGQPPSCRPSPWPSRELYKIAELRVPANRCAHLVLSFSGFLCYRKSVLAFTLSTPRVQRGYNFTPSSRARSLA